MASFTTLYLVQHGESASEEQDPARPLTPRGREEVARVAAAAARAAVAPAAIHHSGKLRARQTAELLAQALEPAGGVLEMAGLAPNDDPAIARRALETLANPPLLVGHLPHLSRLTALLVAGDPAAEVVAFRMGAIVCLERGSEVRWRVRWVVSPDVVR